MSTPRPIRFLALSVLLFLAAHLRGANDFQTQDYDFIDWSTPHQMEQAWIQYVYDGDTIQDRYQRRIRLLGVNAPELANPQQDKFENQPGAIEATRFTERMVRGKNIYLIIDQENSQDKYGRTLALVFVQDDIGEWLCVNWELLREGMGETMVLPDNRLCRPADWHRLEQISQRKRVDDFLALAKLYENEGREKSAVETYQQGIRRFPESRALYENLGRLYSGMRLPGFTVDICLAYLERDPKNIEVRYRLAKAYEEMIGATGFGDYQKKANDTWGQLIGTQYESEARRAIERLQR